MWREKSITHVCWYINPADRLYGQKKKSNNKIIRMWNSVHSICCLLLLTVSVVAVEEKEKETLIPTNLVEESTTADVKGTIVACAGSGCRLGLHPPLQRFLTGHSVIDNHKNESIPNKEGASSYRNLEIVFLPGRRPVLYIFNGTDPNQTVETVQIMAYPHRRRFAPVASIQRICTRNKSTV